MNHQSHGYYVTGKHRTQWKQFYFTIFHLISKNSTLLNKMFFFSMATVEESSGKLDGWWGKQSSKGKRKLNMRMRQRVGIIQVSFRQFATGLTFIWFRLDYLTKIQKGSVREIH